MDDLSTTVPALSACVAAAIALYCTWIVHRSRDRCEDAQERGRRAAAAAIQARRQVERLHQQVTSLLTEYAAPRPVRTCPLDGQPLAWMSHELGEPSRYGHVDGTVHGDRMEQLQAHQAPEVQPIMVQGDPSAPTPAAAQQLADAASPQRADELYFTRVDQLTATGLIDPDRLREGVGNITRNSWRPTAPDTATRVEKAQPAPTPQGPIYSNGDGS